MPVTRVRPVATHRVQKTVAASVSETPKTTPPATAASARPPVAPAALRSASAVPAITVSASFAASQIGVGLQLFLQSAATWLAAQPANPITDALQGAVYGVRRTLFPASVGVVTHPIDITLHEVQYCFDVGTSGCDGTSEPRLGIWATLGTGNTIPQFFEFDTGSAGFYAAYASNDPSVSPWWGSVGVTTGGEADKKFDSGAHYKGVEATTSVSFYDFGSDLTPTLTTGPVKVGRVDEMTKDGDVWTPDGAVDGPPVDQHFYGDFGAGPTYEANGISSLLDELTFARGVTAGYRVNYVPSTDPNGVGKWTLRIGLTDADTKDSTASYFSMVPDPSAPAGATSPRSGTRYFAQQLFLATVTVSNGLPGGSFSDANVGITPDTGADTTVHNTGRAPQNSAIGYASLGDGANLNPGVTLTLTGQAGASTTLFTVTTNNEQVENGAWINIENGKSDKQIYYLNTGIQLFEQNDVVYDMKNGRLGLIPIPGQ